MKNKITKKQIAEQIEILAIEPFQNVLVDAMANGPSQRALREFAEKAPDRWAQFVTMMAKLGGYRPDAKVEIGNIFIQAKEMSDAELSLRVQQMMDSMKLIEGKAVEDGN